MRRRDAKKTNIEIKSDLGIEFVQTAGFLQVGFALFSA